MSVGMAHKFAVERIGQFSCPALLSSRINIFALGLVMLSERYGGFLPSLQRNKGKVHQIACTSLLFMFFQVHYSKSPYH